MTWLQLDLEVAKPSPALWAALDGLVHRARAAGLLDRWFLQRKHPGLRLRLEAAAGRGVPLVLHTVHGLDALAASGEVRSWRHTVYEPEERRTGGPWGTELFWDDACADSTRLLEALCVAPGLRPPGLLGLATAGVLVRAATEDAAEAADVWSRLAGALGPAARATAAPQLAQAEELLSLADDVDALLEVLPAELAPVLAGAVRESRHSAAALLALARCGLLLQGPRAWLVAALPFRLNRAGLGALVPAVVLRAGERAWG